MLCKYGCGEDVTFIDGKPFSLQNHMKVCNKGNAGKKKPAPIKVDRQVAADLTQAFGTIRAQDLAAKYPGKTAEQIVVLELTP